MRSQKTSSASRRSVQVVKQLPAPNNYLYPERNPDEDRLVGTLLLAGEALAEPWRDKSLPRSDAPHAVPEDNDRPVYVEDFEWLREIIELIWKRLAEDPRRAEFLSQLTTQLGDGELLRLLFQNLFPGQKARKALYPDGKQILSARQVAVLREAAGDLSYDEIATKLKISKKTVSRHFEDIKAKLGVNKPMQAVARAISMGYLDLNMFDVIRQASYCDIRDFGELDSNMSQMAIAKQAPHAEELRQLAGLGVALMACNGEAGRLLNYNGANMKWSGIVCQISEQGEIVRSFGNEHLNQAVGIAVAPPHAEQQGFTPGNVFVISRELVSQGLNNAAIVEFTPSGRFVRSFRGGKELTTRLNNPLSLAFAADGQLLVTTGKGILAFSRGGTSVRIFTIGFFRQIYGDSSGQIYASQSSSIGSIIKIFDACGRLAQTFGGTLTDAYYDGIAVNSRGHIVVSLCRHAERTKILIFDLNGTLLRLFSLPTNCGSCLVLDTADRLYVPCWEGKCLLTLSPDGGVIGQLDLTAFVKPNSVALGNTGSVWIAGDGV